MKKIISFYGRGLLPTVILAVIIVLIALLVNLTAPVDNFLELFIPGQYLFPGAGLLFILLVVPFLTAGLTKGKIKKLARKIPFLKMIWWVEEDIPSVLGGAIPVAAKLSNAVIYGFLMGKCKVTDETGFIEGDYTLAVFSPSIPIPLTSVIGTEFEERHVREVEIAGREGRNQARMAIIQNKCFSMGQPLASNIRYKRLKDAEVSELPVLSKEDRLAVIRNIEKELEKLQSAD